MPSLLERIQSRLCSRCLRQEPYPGLLVCRDCAERLVAQELPEWRKNLRAKELRDAA